MPFIHTGDILLKHSDRSYSNNQISFGQLFGHGPSNIVHAGIASSSDSIIEMDGKKLCESFLSIGSNAGETYDVFRCTIPSVATGATEVAKLMWAGVKQRLISFHGMKIAYSGSGKKGALRSIAARDRRGPSDKTSTVFDELTTEGTSFFCSDHVVACYQIAIEQLAREGMTFTGDIEKTFKLESHCYQPAYLWRTLQRSPHFRFVGSTRGGNQIWSKSHMR